MKPVLHKDILAEWKDLDPKKGIAIGYFSAFNNVDSYGDIMLPTAFNKTLAEQGPQSPQPRIKHLLNHDTEVPVGKLNVLQPDNYGLYFESAIGTNEDAQDFIKMVESGLITENSIGYRTIKAMDNADGTRILQEVALYEGSSLTFLGVNSKAKFIGLKSLEAGEMLKKRMDNIELFCRNSTATDATIMLLLSEVKELNQIIINLKAEDTTQPIPESITKPDQAKGFDWGYIANQLITNQFSQR